MNKKIVISVLLIGHSVAYGRVHIFRSIGRHIGTWSAHKVKESPKEAAGAGVGAYFGYHIAHPSFKAKVHGILAGAFLGAYLVRSHSTYTKLAAQLEAEHVYATAVEKDVKKKLTILTNQVGRIEVAQRQTSAEYSRKKVPQETSWLGGLLRGGFLPS